MPFRLAADAVLILHLLFIVFAVAGGLLALRWRWAPLLHLPAAAWAVWVEVRGLPCPLSELENDCLRRAGQAGYGDGFVAHYLLPIIYPAGLTPRLQLVLGALVLVANAAIYVWVWRRPARPAS